MYNVTNNTKPLFEKFIINKDYSITKLVKDGTERKIISPEEIKKILDTDYLAGSIAISHDTSHKGWMHTLFYVGQKIHTFFFQRKADVDLCHSMIILKGDRPKKGQEGTHPFVLAHAFVGGVQTSKTDYLTFEDVTEVIVYRPLKKSLRDKIIEHAYQTAFIKKKENRFPNSPQIASPFTMKDIATSIFGNKKHEVCRKDGHRLSKKMMQNTANVLADLLLGKQILDNNGRLKPLFCTTYAASILQGSLLADSLKHFSSSEREKFLKNQEGDPLNRQELAEKIRKCFEYKDKKNSVCCHLWEIYWGNKLARLDTENLLTCYLGKYLDKFCKSKKSIEPTYNIVNYEKKLERNWLERIVRWFKDKINFPPLVKKIATYIGAGIVTILALGTFLPYFKR